VAPYVQDTALALRDETFEETYDKNTILIKQLYEKISRCLSLPVTSAFEDITIPDPDAGYYLRWNSTEDGLENAAISVTGSTETTENETIASGEVTYTENGRNINLTGEGNLADSIVTINEGTAGNTVTLWRYPGKAYTVTVTPGSGLHMENNQSFELNSDYDNITFTCRGSGVWVETSRVNAT
jgi:hypothetical protein